MQSTSLRYKLLEIIQQQQRILARLQNATYQMGHMTGLSTDELEYAVSDLEQQISALQDLYDKSSQT